MGTTASKYALPNGQVRVYDWWQKPGLGTVPKGFMAREDADEAVRRKFATRCVKGFAIQVKPDPSQRFKKWLEVIIRGDSAKMGPRVTEGAADEIPYFVSIVEGWAPC